MFRKATPAKTQACGTLQLDRPLRWARLELQTAEECLQVHTQRCTYAQSRSHTFSCHMPPSLQNRPVNPLQGHPPHKTLGNITPKVFYFDEVLYYQINKVRRKQGMMNTLEEAEGCWARFSALLCDGKKLKPQLLCFVPGIQLTLATGHS